MKKRARSKTIEEEMAEIGALFRRLNSRIVRVDLRVEEAEEAGRFNEVQTVQAAIAKFEMTDFLKTMSQFWKHLYPTIFDENLLEDLKRESERR